MNEVATFPSILLSEVALSPAILKTKQRYAEKLGEERKLGIYSPSDWARISYVLDQLPKQGSVLDVGVGAGQLINTIAGSGDFLSVEGIDIATHSNFLRMDAPFDVKKMSVAKMAFPDRSFDVVVCMEVLEHLAVADFEAAVRELRRVARKQIVVSVPFEEPEPIASYHKQRFDLAKIRAIFPKGRLSLLQKVNRKSCPWALVVEDMIQ
jgi:2-polyprenyl-3-methyl-5-hydroxy-6-metoxy-1,4-benzoquinol methylase